MTSAISTGYLDAFEAIELELEEFDTRVMGRAFEEPEDELGRPVVLRRDVGALRRALGSHRRMFLALTRPEIDAVTTSEHTERFRASSSVASKRSFRLLATAATRWSDRSTYS